MRVRGVRSECVNREIHLLGILADHATRRTERRFHHRFKALRISGEWFQDDESIRALIDPSIKPKHLRQMTVYLKRTWIQAIRMEAIRRGVSASAMVASALLKDRGLAANLRTLTNGKEKR